MNFDFKEALFIKRYKRFLVDVIYNNEVLTVHCPNTGSMLNCYKEGDTVLISKSNNPKRKYAYTLEVIRHNECNIGVNTSIANSLVHEAIENKVITFFDNIKTIKPEVTFKEYGSRADFVLTNDKEEQIVVEVKNVTLANDNVAMFPDAITLRGQKHLSMLIDLVKKGHKACLLFCVQHENATSFTPAANIDKEYAALLKEAKLQGVAMYALQASFSENYITLNKNIPILI